MVDKICDFITNRIKKEMPEVDEERAEVINYGVHLLFGEIPKTFIFIIIALALGILKEFILAMLIIMPYRAVSGGVHLKTHIGCILGTSIAYCGTAYLSKIIVFEPIYLKYIVIALVWTFGMIMVKLYAPADTENVPILRKEDRRRKKILSYVILTIYLVISIFIKNNLISNIIILGMFMQSIMISRFVYKITKNKYGYEEYLKGNI